MPKATEMVKDVEFPLGGRGEDAAPPLPASRLDDEESRGDASEEIIPEGYDSEWAFLEYWLKQYSLDYDADKHNREEAEKDLHFTYVDQWDPEEREKREEAGRPCLTINTMPQFIGQVIGDRRLNRTAVKIIPLNKAAKKQALVRQGLLRAIESHSDAERVFDMCCEDQVVAGFSNFEVAMDYATNDAFEQDIFYRSLPNPFAVTWDRMSRDPTGKDARHCFVEEDIPTDVFEEDFDIHPPSGGFPSAVEGLSYSDWCNKDTVKVVALWVMVEKPATFALMQDGDVEDVTGKSPVEYLHRVVIHPKTGQPMIRQGVRTYAQRWLISGFKILEGPYELPLSRLPVIRVSGRIGRVGTKQYRFGLVRWARDPMLLRNYWRSTSAELVAMAPKTQWVAEAAAVKGFEDDYRTAHITGDPLLRYNTGKKQPQRENPPDIPAAVINEATMNSQDIKDVTGLHDASLGIRSNEVSGRAIMARQREGDVATITYHDHLNLAIQEAGRVASELMPIAYDTMRTVRIIGPTEEDDFVEINNPGDPDGPDITVGKYDYRVITGPSFTTQRQEAAESMMEAMKVMPEAMSQALDIIMEAQDWPMADKLAERMRKVLGIEDENAEPSEEQMMQQQMMVQQMQQQQELQNAAFEAQMAEMQGNVQKLMEELRKLTAQADKAEAEAEEARHSVTKAYHDSEKAEAEADKAEIEVVTSRHESVRGFRQAEMDAASAAEDRKAAKSRGDKGSAT